MAIRRQPAPVVRETEEDETPAVSAGPVAVPPASDASSPAKRGRSGPRGPQLSWGLVVKTDGGEKVLQLALVEIARETSAKHGGYATLADLVSAVRAHPIFTDNVTSDGTTLSDLVTKQNVGNQWCLMRDKFVIQWAARPTNEGGLGFEIPSSEDFKTTAEWKRACRALFTDGQWAQMEDAISRPKPQGKDFPKLVVRRGRRSSGGLNIEDI